MMHTTSSGTVPDHIPQTAFDWEGQDASGQSLRGSLRASGEHQVRALLRRQGITPSQVLPQRPPSGPPVRAADISAFTRQLGVMMQAGLPLLQAFDIVGRGHPNARVRQLLAQIRADIATGTALSTAFAQHPKYFNPLYCQLVAAGEASGQLQTLLDRLATHLETTQAIKTKVLSALAYPAAVLAVAAAVISLIMVLVIPTFEQVFQSFGAQLPAPTQALIATSAFVRQWGWLLLVGLGGGVLAFWRRWQRSEPLQRWLDHHSLRLPVIGRLLQQAVLARWCRTLATLFAAGVPLVDALESVAGAAGNWRYHGATQRIQQDVARGISLSAAMELCHNFPPMAVQMCAIGEESGRLDHMLHKAADIYEADVNTTVATLSKLMEPLLIVTLGVVIGGIVLSLYLPIFQLGQVF